MADAHCPKVGGLQPGRFIEKSVVVRDQFPIKMVIQIHDVRNSDLTLTAHFLNSVLRLLDP